MNGILKFGCGVCGKGNVEDIFEDRVNVYIKKKDLNYNRSSFLNLYYLKWQLLREVSGGKQYPTFYKLNEFQ